MAVSHLETLLLAQLALAGFPAPEREVRLIPGRRFRCDLVWRPQRLVCEVEGGVWTGGRHTRGAGFTRDCEKYNELELLRPRWAVLRITAEHIRSGQALAWLERALKEEPHE